jgi:hypothetical protein
MIVPSFLFQLVGCLVVMRGERSTRQDGLHAWHGNLADISDRGNNKVLGIVSPHAIFDPNAIKLNGRISDNHRGRAFQMIVEDVWAIGEHRSVIDGSAIRNHKNDLPPFGTLLHSFYGPEDGFSVYVFLQEVWVGHPLQHSPENRFCLTEVTMNDMQQVA